MFVFTLFTDHLLIFSPNHWLSILFNHRWTLLQDEGGEFRFNWNNNQDGNNLISFNIANLEDGENEFDGALDLDDLDDFDPRAGEQSANDSLLGWNLKQQIINFEIS